MITLVEEQEVQALVDRREAIDIIESVYRAVASGRAAVSHPAAMSLKGPAGAGTSFKIKGALLEEFNVAGFRCIGDSEQGDGGDYVFLFDAENATPRALVSENWLHRLRTAATGLVTCRALAPKGANSLALIGTGRIAEEFLRIVHFAFPDLPVVLASRSPERTQKVVQEWRTVTQNPLSAAESIPHAVRSSDIVVTLSDANERLFAATDIKSRALLCAMGGRHEFDVDVLQAASHLIVDEIDFVCTAGNGAYWISSGQITRPALEKSVDATIGELLIGREKLHGDGIVLAIIQGMAVCDVALAQLVFERKSRKRS